VRSNHEDVAQDLGRQIIGRQLVAVAALEGDIASALQRQAQSLQAHPRLAETLARLQAQAGAQQRVVEKLLRSRGQPARDGASPLAAWLESAEQTVRLAALLQADWVACQHLVMGYAILCEMALRGYDVALREIAPKHMQVYARAARSIEASLLEMVAQEPGLECHCICPMCSLGACGCVAAGQAWLHQAGQESEVAKVKGFALQPPRPSSQLAEAGIKGGDRLLAIDGQAVKSVADIQSEIRKHKIGDAMEMRLARGSKRLQVVVKHVGDYPE
jgi:hypothetical protein